MLIAVCAASAANRERLRRHGGGLEAAATIEQRHQVRTRYAEPRQPPSLIPDPYFTVTVTLAFLPFAVFTVIVTLPFFTPLTSPLLFTLAMRLSELVQV